MKPLPCPSVLNSPSRNTQGAEFSTRQTFSRIPDEIVENVFLEDVFSARDLYNVALVNRRFSRLVRNSLYSEVEILLRSEVSVEDEVTRSSAPPYLLVRECKPFKRTLMEHPELACFVRSAKLSFAGYQCWYRGYDFPVYRQAHGLLQLLPSLRALELQFYPYSERRSYGSDESGGQIGSNKLSSLFDIPMAHLRRLSFIKDTRQESINEVIKALTLPHIKCLSIDFKRHLSKRYGHESHDTDLGKSFQSDLLGTSSVESLTLTNCSELVALESKLLKIPHGLKKLECHIRLSKPPLDPGAAISTLGLLCPNIVCLDLHFDMSSRSKISGSVADFSSFTSLKTLVVDDYLCFRTWPYDNLAERRGFYHRLPSGLEMLRVNFCPCYCSDGWAKLEDQLSDDNRWLLELAEYKSSNFPGLNEVELHEDARFLRAKIVEWVYNDDVFGAFETSGIHLLVSLMVVVARHGSMA